MLYTYFCHIEDVCVCLGRQFDRYGNLKNSWTQHALQGFRKGAQCIIDQYSNYTIPEIGLNVSFTRIVQPWVLPGIVCSAVIVFYILEFLF